MQLQDQKAIEAITAYNTYRNQCTLQHFSLVKWLTVFFLSGAQDGLVEACMAYSGQSEDGGTLRWLGDLEPRLAQRHLSQPSPADSPDHHNYEGRSLALALADKVGAWTRHSGSAS